MSHRMISTEKAPKAVGPYSQGCLAGNLIFISGQLPIDPSSGAMISDDIKKATAQCLENVLAIAHSASEKAHLVKVVIYLVDMGRFPEMNEAYSEFFKENPPARACVEVRRLPKDAIIEIEAVAVVDFDES